jgi:hypothetical protein
MPWFVLTFALTGRGTLYFLVAAGLAYFRQKH